MALLSLQTGFKILGSCYCLIGYLGLFFGVWDFFGGNGCNRSRRVPWPYKSIAMTVLILKRENVILGSESSSGIPNTRKYQPVEASPEEGSKLIRGMKLFFYEERQNEQGLSNLEKSRLWAYLIVPFQ